MKPRPILVATVLRPSGDTGVQTHFNTLIRQARMVGADVRLLTPYDLPAAMVYPAFGPGRLAKPLSPALWVWWHRESHRLLLRHRLLRELERTPGAVVYAQDPVSARAALEARERGHAAEVVLAVHFNVSQADEWAQAGCIAHGGRLFRRIAALEAEVLPRMDRIIFPSRFVREEVVRRVPAAAAVPAAHVPNFVLQWADRGARAPEAELINIGTLEPRKNQAFLLRVLAHCHRMGLRYRLTVVGDGPLRAELQALAAELGVAGHVSFPGFVPNAARLVPRHRAYVHAAHLENHPMVLLEALAAGRPVFAPPVGGIPEVFSPGVEGELWSPDDPEAAAGLLASVLELPGTYARMCAAARRRYERDYTAEAAVPKLLRAILGAAPPASAPEPLTAAGEG